MALRRRDGIRRRSVVERAALAGEVGLGEERELELAARRARRAAGRWSRRPRRARRSASATSRAGTSAAASRSTARCAEPCPSKTSATRQPSRAHVLQVGQRRLGVAAVGRGRAERARDRVRSGAARVTPHHGRPSSRGLGLRPRPARAATRRARSTGALPPPAATAHDASRNSCEVRTRSAERVRTRSGSHSTTWAPAGSSCSTSASSSTSTGASASMPSTASPRLIGSSSSASSGCSREQLAARCLHLGGQQQLAARRRPQPVLGDLERALVGDLEVADLLDLVAPELHPQRVLLGRREDVEDAAAHREVAALLDQLGAGVAGRRRGRSTMSVSSRPVVAGVQLDRHQLAEAGHLRLEQRAHRRHHHRQRPGGRVVGRTGARAGAARPAAGRPCPRAARAARAAASPSRGRARPRPAAAGSAARRRDPRPRGRCW